MTVRPTPTMSTWMKDVNRRLRRLESQRRRPASPPAALLAAPARLDVQAQGGEFTVEFPPGSDVQVEGTTVRVVPPD